MGGRLVAAAGQVEIGDGAVVENPERIHSLRRDVDSAAVRRGRSEKDRLSLDELAKLGSQCLVELGHDEFLTGLLRGRRSGGLLLAPFTAITRRCVGVLV